MRAHPLLARHLQLVRFLVSGGICFAVEVAVFALVFALQPLVSLANAIAVAVASCLNYGLHVAWVFRTTARPRTTASRYAASLVVSYLLSTTLVIGVAALGAPEVAAKVCVSLGLAPLAFLAGRHWVYPGS